MNNSALCFLVISFKLFLSFISPGLLGVSVDVGRGEDPGWDVVLGHVHVLHAPLDRVLVLVAVHAGDVEEDPAQGGGDPRLHRAKTSHELAVALATKSSTVTTGGGEEEEEGRKKNIQRCFEGQT